MALTQEQQDALTALETRMPEDLVSGYEAPDVTDAYAVSPWLDSLHKLALETKGNAAAKYNLRARSERPSQSGTIPQRVMSAEGFPSTVTVSHVPAPKLGYEMPGTPREIKHIVLHSYGHAWHATNVPGSRGWGGWLNNAAAGMGVVPYEHEGKTVYIAQGSDSTTLSHPQRVSGALQAAVGSKSRTCMHYMIDRSGNLTVVGDANYIMFSSDAANESAVAITLEEAFYLVKHPNEERATWSPDGTPPNTGGNVQYFAFTSAQLLTLSIVCRKLEVAFNIPQTISISRRSLDSGSAPGYTMHDFIKGSSFPDISPHFLDQSLWDSFFALVSSHTTIDVSNIWVAPSKYIDSSKDIITQPISASSVSGITEQALSPIYYAGIGRARAISFANAGRSERNYSSANETLEESRNMDLTTANAYTFYQQSENTPSSWVEEGLEQEDQGGWDEEEVWG